jgi:hypothetical protein
MEQLLIELGKIFGGILAGGSLTHLINRRLKRRELNNKISKEEYETFDAILEGFMQRNSRLATDIADIREQKAAIENKYNRLREIITTPDCICRAKGLV